MSAGGNLPADSALASPRRIALLLGAFLNVAPGHGTSQAQPAVEPLSLERLLKAYPEHLDRIEGAELVWKDGTRMALSDGPRDKTASERIARASILDMLFEAYPAGAPITPPAFESDPGRARHAPFFDKMYGDCRKGEVTGRLVDVVWLPKKWGGRIKATTINAVDKRLEAVSRALDQLPASFDAFLKPPAGTYNCRAIAGTDRISAHGAGIAIDIALPKADYWRWSTASADGRLPYRNRVPAEIVAIFEAHGFIWGGRWYHYDTMHFEYRPELIPEAIRTGAASAGKAIAPASGSSQ